ncbi:MAG: hypothetical protein R2759_09420 [Bacteroidales bacterium]
MKAEILEDEFSEISETILTDARYGFIAGALRETCSGYQEKALASNRNIDDLLTHKDQIPGVYLSCGRCSRLRLPLVLLLWNGSIMGVG